MGWSTGRRTLKHPEGSALLRGAPVQKALRTKELTRALQVARSGFGTASLLVALAYLEWPAVLNSCAGLEMLETLKERSDLTCARPKKQAQRHPLTSLNTCWPTSRKEECLARPGWIPNREK